MTDGRTGRLLTLALFVTLALVAVAPIRSYDFFWHLATGRWIVEHRALPATDPFAVASDRTPWINGEWLFEVVLYFLHQLFGVRGLALLRGLAAGALFTTVFLIAKRRASFETALLLTIAGFAGALRTFDVRPASAAPFFVVAALTIRSLGGYGLLSLLWINVHPSALLAPFIAGVSWLGRRSSWLAASAAALTSAIALMVNPHGLAAVTAPFALLSYLGEGTFVNAEWRPSSIAAHPLLYICIALAGFSFLFQRRAVDETEGDERELWGRIILTLLFSWLAVRHVRHQTIFFAAFPLLVAPSLARLKVSRPLAYVASALALIAIALTTAHGTAVSPRRFPVAAVDRLVKSGLQGNVYNADQFGGYLIWRFYPERRTLTDGRNELYRHYLPEYARARGDQRAWDALLKRYRIVLAVDEYRKPLEVLDAVSGRKTTMPASLAYWPRDEWALIAFDAAAMVFARRDAFPADTLQRLELQNVPDEPNAAFVPTP